MTTPDRRSTAAVGLLLCASGALLAAASWERWSRVCPLAGTTPGCDVRQDHVFDFLPPTVPWTPLGRAAELAGGSLIVLAVALVAMPWVLNAHRGRLMPLLGASSGVATLAVGIATLVSGIRGVVTDPVLGPVTTYCWLLAPPVVYCSLLVTSRGWGRAAAAALLASSPLVAAVSYAVGPYDARPWWEAVSGGLLFLAGLGLLAVAVRLRSPSPAPTEIPGVLRVH